MILKKSKYLFALKIILFSFSGCSNDSTSTPNPTPNNTPSYFKFTIISGEKVRDSKGTVMTIEEAAEKAITEINSGKKLEITLGNDARISDDVTTKRHFKKIGIQYKESTK